MSGLCGIVQLNGTKTEIVDDRQTKSKIDRQRTEEGIDEI